MASLALKSSFFLSGSCIVVFIEYCNLYMKQLGLNPSQIGFTTLFGVMHLLLPFLGFLGDRFRARKLIFTAMTAVLFLTTLAPLLPLVVSLPTCFAKKSESAMNQTGHHSKEYLQNTVNTSVEEVKQNTSVPWLSALFLFMVITRCTFTLAERAFVYLLNLATITYLQEKRASFGSYVMWCHISSSVSLFSVGLLAAHFRLSICGVIGDGYYITFVWASAAIMLSSFAVPWFRYEYLEHRVISWTEVKCVFSDIHYVLVLIIALYLGGCISFQFYWEFWYISELSGSPTIMGVGGLIRRPLVGMWFYLSGHLIEKVGDLKTIAVALFLFSLSFMAISFINIPWLILLVDLVQAAGYSFSYSALNVHFSKPGSKASSAVILGLFEMVFSIGVDAGSGVMGLLFHAIGSKTTLFCYSITSAIILVAFLAYIYFAKDLEDYEKLPED